jgi:hypothetical protein
MMPTSEATAQIFWTAFCAMPKKEREAIIEKLLAETEFMEDLFDSVILKQRENEPSRPLEEYLAKRKGRRV